MRVINSRWFAIPVPALMGLGLAALCVRFFEHYGWSLFLGLPVLVCFLSAFCTSFRRTVSFSSAYWTSVASLLCLGCFILVFALDGAICLLMALPLAMSLGIIGAAFGSLLGSACRGGLSSVLPLLLVFMFPGLVAFDRTTSPPESLRSVTTSVVVRAPIERVWQTVIAFPKISEPPTGIFRWGIAYPMEARIDGSGVGAIRHCVFSTGSFVEPITRWEEPVLLAFDVSASPPPMRELSLYEHVEAPHLHGHMVSHRGQFRLIERDGQVVLEGTTWYTHTLSPQWYWGADFRPHHSPNPRACSQPHQTHERTRLTMRCRDRTSLWLEPSKGLVGAHLSPIPNRSETRRLSGRRNWAAINFCNSPVKPFSFRSLSRTTFITVTLAVCGATTQAEQTGTPRRILGADDSTKRLAIIAPDGAVEWETKVGAIHDAQLLPNGNILLQQGWTKIVEMTPDKQTIWEYDAAQSNGNAGKKVEVHSFQRLPDGNTTIAESGSGRIIEVDRAGALKREIKLKIDHPSTHSGTRLVRKIANGNYLVAHESDGTVREYDGTGAIVWEYEVPLFGKEPKGGHGPEAFGNAVFNATRLANGNTLIGTGNGHSVLEVTPDKEIVWKLEQNDLPGIRLAWVTRVQRLPNGNTLIGNCHAGPDQPQFIEVTPGKEVVWSFKDFTVFGDSMPVQIALDAK